jgi:predicted RNA-binding protein with PIN domain
MSGTPARSGERVWIVDAMNVIGSRPTGWWRDRGAAVHRLLDATRRFVSVTGEAVTLVVDGRPRADLPEGEHDGVRVVYASRPGANAADDRIVALVAACASASGIRVVTSDRRLQGRVRQLGARVEPVGAWVRVLDAAAGTA